MWIRSSRLLIALAITTGCTSRGQSLRWTAVGAGMTAAGAGMLYSLQDEEEVPSQIVVFTGGLLLVGATITLLSGVNAILFADPAYDDTRVDPAPAAAPPEHPGRERAWSLTKASAAAARAGDCAAVRDADTTVRDLDPELHAIVFRRDVAITRCLGMGTVPSSAD